MNKQKFTNTKLGIWGLGIVGRAALRFFSDQGADCDVFDQKKPTPRKLIDFLKFNEYILPSPGIDLRPYGYHQHKFLAEADVFGQFWKKPIIGITGSAGKTTVTTLLAQIMEAAGYRVAIGGNIGIGMLDLIADQEKYDYALLELSSFQLELCKSFAPDLAIWTNFYPNHLDRHGTVEHYFNAKLNILRRQTDGQRALVDDAVWEKIRNKPVWFDMAQGPTHHERVLDLLHSASTESHEQILNTSSLSYPFVVSSSKSMSNHTDMLPIITHPQNWQTIIQALELLNIPFPDLEKINFKLPEHRLEKVATINGVTFYNDSKATISEATLAAVEQLHSTPHDNSLPPSNIILLLGGVSKGVDRKPLVSALKNRVEHVIAFGDEADDIAKLCSQDALSCISCATLQTAFDEAIKKVNHGDKILLSPGGASFDLFSNYQTRGTTFKELVAKLSSPHIL